MKMTRIVQLYDYMHNDLGMSTGMIAKTLGKRKNSIISALRYHGKLKESLGKSVERDVERYLLGRGHIVEAQRGDAHFDLLVDGKRIDVKSSNMSCNRYYFAIVHKQAPEKDITKHVDSFYLVFTDIPGRPMYEVEAHEMVNVRNISINADLHSKRKLVFIGNLDESYQVGVKGLDSSLFVRALSSQQGSGLVPKQG